MAELSLNLPVVGEKDTTAEPKVTTALTEIQTQINGKIASVNLEAGAVGGAAVKAELTGPRLLERAGGFLSQNEAAGTYFFRVGSNAAKKAAASVVKYTLDVPELLVLQPAKFTVASKTTKLVLVVATYTNAVAPTSSFTFGLFPLESVKGAGNELELKYEAVVAGSEAKVTTPAKETATAAEATFAFPVVGHYSLGVVTSAETAANSLTSFTMELFVKNE